MLKDTLDNANKDYQIMIEKCIAYSLTELWGNIPFHVFKHLVEEHYVDVVYLLAATNDP